MALEEARAYLAARGYEDRIRVFEVSGCIGWIDVCQIPEES